MRQTLEVDIRVNDALREHLALSQQRTVLRDKVVTRENKVLRGLAEAGVRIQVRAQQSSGLLTNKVAAIARLADDLIRCGQVDDNVRAICASVVDGGFGTHRSSQISTPKVNSGCSSH